MKCTPEYWIWLQRTLGAGAHLDEILAYFGDPATLYEAGRCEWIRSGVISEKAANALVKYSPSESYSVMKNCRDNGWRIITPDSGEYPRFLKQIYSYPAVLYVWGDIDVLNCRVPIGIVGTRNASYNGTKVAESLSFELAKAGAVIVSGGALGIDSASHTGAINAGGKTVAFLGCGLGHGYLKENEQLRRTISENGAVVSEYMPFTPPSHSSFPIRNRLISGMSLGIVVVEAGIKSGSLITARCALDQGRDVFAVPGNLFDSFFTGTNNLIRDGARAVFSAMDVLDGYLNEYGDSLNVESSVRSYTPLRASGIKEQMPNNSVYVKDNNKKTADKNVKINKTNKTVKEKEKINSGKERKKAELPEYISENSKKLYAVLNENAQIADELVLKTGLPVQEVLSALTELEIYGLVRSDSGSRYFVESGTP